MTRTISDLNEQAERAERLARTGVDPLTVERLRTFAAECRGLIAAVAERLESDRPAAAQAA